MSNCRDPEEISQIYQAIIAGSVGKQNTYGTIVGKIAPNKTTFCRVTTDDTAGILTGYV